jgi:hypothetical protein
MEKNSNKKTQKIFIVISVLFILIMLFIGYDISKRTTFPGSKKHLKESIAPSD